MRNAAHDKITKTEGVPSGGYHRTRK